MPTSIQTQQGRPFEGRPLGKTRPIELPTLKTNVEGALASLSIASLFEVDPCTKLNQRRGRYFYVVICSNEDNPSSQGQVDDDTIERMPNEMGAEMPQNLLIQRSRRHGEQEAACRSDEKIWFRATLFGPNNSNRQHCQK